MKKILVLFFLVAITAYFGCNNNSSDADGTYSFTITYNPNGGQQWSESGTGKVVADGENVTINVTMTTGEKYVRKLKISGKDAVLKGTYTQPVASDPKINETATYDGTGTFDGKTLTANGTYTFTIPDLQVNEQGTFNLTATKK